MQIKLLQLEQRVAELESLADRAGYLANHLTLNSGAQPELSNKGHSWFRGAREFLIQQKSSGFGEFEACYIRMVENIYGKTERDFCDIEQYLSHGLAGDRVLAGEHYPHFCALFAKARSLVLAAVEEVKSRELPVITALSFALSADEFDKAQEILAQSGGDEALLRASGVVARVGLERHLFTVADAHRIQVIPAKKKAEAQDVLNALHKSNVITAIQKSDLENLFKIANNCAHPNEIVLKPDVEKLIARGRELASIIL